MRDTDEDRPRKTDLLRNGDVERVACRGCEIVAVLLAQVDLVVHGCAATQTLAEQQDHTVESEETRGRKWLCEHHAQRVLEGQSENSGGDGRNDKQPGEAFVGGLDATPSDRREETADDAQPVFPIEDQQGQRGRYMQPDYEGKVRRLAA